MSSRLPSPEVVESQTLVARVLYEGAFLDLLLRDLRRRDAITMRRRIERRVRGVLEQRRLLEAFLRTRLRRPGRSLPEDVHVALLVGLWRLVNESGAPAAVIVNETVASIAAGAHKWARGLVNAVLRGVASEPKMWTDFVAAQPSYLRWGFPEQWAPLLSRALGTTPSETVWRGLRTNPGVHVALLSQDKVPTLPPMEALPIPGAYRLTGDVGAFWQHPVYTNGHAVVRDLSVSAWLHALPRVSTPVWDAFAAPGGKLIGLLSRGVRDVTATDRHPRRLQLLTRALARLQLQPSQPPEVVDVEVPPWSAERRFATVVADLPCSGSGTVVRHPEAAWRAVQDLDAMVDRQLRYLRVLAPRVAADGDLWVLTCSLFYEENEGLVEQFLTEHPGWRRRLLRHPMTGETCETVRFWPHRDICQGFAYQCLQRVGDVEGAR